MDGIKLVLRDFQGSIDVERMVRTANEIIKRNDETVAMLYGSNDKNARIMVMAGKAAVEKGADANEIVRGVSAIIGGGGGGKPNFAQGGGIETDQLPKAVKAAKELLRKQLKKKAQ
jgi:alanyl-tRNA synthetase